MENVVVVKIEIMVYGIQYIGLPLLEIKNTFCGNH